MQHEGVAVLADGRAVSVNLRVVATADSHHGNYSEGDLGTVVKAQAGKDPVVRWDASGKETPTNRTKIRAHRILLADGQAAAVGLRVIAVSASSHSNRYVANDTGTIVQLHVADPVVRWDRTGQEHQTARGRIKRLPNLVLSDGQAPVVGLEVEATEASRYGHYRVGDTGTIVRLTDVNPIVRWKRTGQEQLAQRLQIRGRNQILLSDGVAAAPGMRVQSIVTGLDFDEGDTGLVVRLDNGAGKPVVRWDRTEKEAVTLPASVRCIHEAILVDGERAVVGLRVVALESSAFGNYSAGDTGKIVRLGASDPVVCWDSTGEECQASRTKLRATHHFELVDGQTAAVGLRVVATADCAEHHHFVGDVGTVVRLDPTNPVVRWDLTQEAHLTRRTQIKGLPPPLAHPDGDEVELAPSGVLADPGARESVGSGAGPDLPTASGLGTVGSSGKVLCKHAPCCYHQDPEHFHDFDHGIQPAPSRGSRVLILYHIAPTVGVAEALRAKGNGTPLTFANLTTGTLGRGVYVYRSREQALALADSDQGGERLLRVQVAMRKVKRVTRKGGLQTTWHEAGYDVAWIPPKNTQIGDGREETCVWDPAQCRVVVEEGE